jgi:hypothetical protein
MPLFHTVQHRIEIMMGTKLSRKLIRLPTALTRCDSKQARHPEDPRLQIMEQLIPPGINVE